MIPFRLERTWIIAAGILLVVVNVYDAVLKSSLVLPSLPRGGAVAAPPLPPFTPNAPSHKEIDIVVAHCHEDLTWLDQFGQNSCHRIHVHIYSKCGETDIPTFAGSIADCVTVHRIANCGTQEFAFFRHVHDRYDDHDGLANMTAFIQAGSLSENPHVMQDILSYIPGTTYTELARHVRPAWHVKRKGPAERALQQQTAPLVFRQSTWLIGWRAMYMVSRDTLRHVDKSLYAKFNEQLCSGECRFVNCAWEHWFGPTYGCAPVLFEQDGCVSHDPLPFARSTMDADFRKDSLVKVGQDLAQAT